MSLRKAHKSPLASLEELREVLCGFPQIKALTIEEVRLSRSEPAIVKDFAIKVEGPSKDALLATKTLDDLTDEFFRKNTSPRQSTLDLLVDVMEDFFISQGQVTCDWPDALSPLNFG